MLVCVAQFMLGEAGAALDDQAARIHQPVPLDRIGLGKALGHHRRDDEVRNAGCGFASPQEQDSLVGKLAAADTQRGEQPGQRDRGRSLNVVIEDRNVVTVFVKQAERGVIGKILKLDQHTREGFARRRDEFIDEIIIGLSAHAFLAQADIITVVQKILIVGADIQHDGQAIFRMDAGAGGIKRKLADRNAHAVRAEIAKAQDPFTVGDDDQLGLIGPVAEQLGDVAAIVGADEHAARPLEDQAETLTGEAHGRRIDQWLDFIDVVANDPEKQRLVAVMQ